jgi:4-alpha-glucanotransferase
LRLAYSRFGTDKDYTAFLKKNSDWIYDYALFMSLKHHYNFCEWTKWDIKHRDIRSAREHKDEFVDEMGFWQWLQYVFDKQWNAVRDYAHKKGIVIIGDMPIYASHDSMDVWCNPKQFLIDDEYNPIVVAGCPPDAFSEDGQLWGNPIYNWQVMSFDDFEWWKKRVGRAFMLYDILRIDHFRGFASFYAIPYGDENAKRGNWISAPGKALFDEIKKEYPNAKIVFSAASSLL